MSEGSVQKSNGGSSKNKLKSKFDFDSLYEELKTKYPALAAHQEFWTRKGNSQKYTCTLCNISIQATQNLNAFKEAIKVHTVDQYHKKRYEAYLSKSNMKNLQDYEQHSVPESESQNENTKNCLKIENVQIGSGVSTSETTFHNNIRGGEKFVDFDTVYNTFEKSNPIIKTSKQFITKQDDGRNFYCKLCEVLIFNSLNATEFRYNLFVHLNEDKHRERLPNFPEIEESFRKLMQDLSAAIPKHLEDDLKYFEIGPVFRFVQCSLCEMAVSVNLHRLENHIVGDDHREKKVLVEKGSVKKTLLSNRTRDAFRKLVVKLDDRFKKDIKYIHIGKIPGYVLCSLCSYVVLPTQFYVETHLESPVHVNNKARSNVNKQSKFRVRLEDLMKTLPCDLKDYNIFLENICGLTCKQCHDSIPPTSYDLYSHIIKERGRVLK